jgi:serine phosphatase RsbU (regulator of sigma subunit)
MNSQKRPVLRSRRVVIALASVCLLFLACIPAATARSDHERAGSVSSASSSSGSSSKDSKGSSEAHAERVEARAERKESAASGSESKGTSAEKSERHSKSSTSGASSSSKEASTDSSQSTTSGSHRGGTTQHHQDTAHHGQGGTRHAQSTSSAAPAPAGSKAKANARSGGSGGSSAESRRAQEQAGKPKGSHVARGKAKIIEAAHPSTLQSESTSTPATVSSPSTPSATVPALAASSTATPLLAKASLATGAAPSVARRSPQSLTGAAKSTHHTPGAAAHGAGSSSSASESGLPVASAPALLASAGKSSAHAKHAAKPGVTKVHYSPLVNTITRIVGVVPTPIRILIGVLVALALAMTARSRLSVLRARRLERQRGELLEDVGLLQAALLPVTPARLGPVGTSAAYRPATGPAAGGDFYDVFALEDGKLAVIVGDVSGHGREALPHTALVRFTLRAYLEAGLSPRGAVQTAGSVLERQLGGSFATVVAATYNPRERVLVYASAGHPPPVVRGCEPDAQPLEPVTTCSSPPIGVGLPTGVRQSIVAVPGGAQICFFTDGVTEARVAGELYGVQRLNEALVELGPQATAADVLDSVSHTADRCPDDMAACLLHVEGSNAAPMALVEELELSREEASSDRTEQFLDACGVAPAEAIQIVRAARLEAERSGSAVIEVHRGDGPPEVSIQQDNLAYLQTRHAARQADMRVSV